MSAANPANAANPTNPANAAAEPRHPRRRWRRVVARLLVLTLTLLVTASAAASWYYSGRIESDALRVNPGVWERPFVVTAVLDDTATTADIVLTPRVGDDAADWQAKDLRSGTVQGLHWDDGFAQTASRPTPRPATPSSPPATLTNPVAPITVTVTLLRGEWPNPGDRIGVHAFAFPQGIVDPWQRVTFPGPSGSLEAAYQPGTATTWVVMVHGKGAAPDEFTRMALTTTALGLPTLAITYRGDPGMPPEPADRYGFGASEWPDLRAAVGYAASRGARSVVLVGASMGGAIVASYLRHAADTSLVRAVVLDAPALSLEETIEWGAAQTALPGGLTLPTPVTWGAKRLATWRFGLDWAAVDYVSDPDWCRLPTLVFHGTADLTVPVTTSRELASRCSWVTLVEVGGAGHVAAWNVDPAAYDARLRAFLAPILARPG